MRDRGFYGGIVFTTRSWRVDGREYCTYFRGEGRDLGKLACHLLRGKKEL